MTAREETDPGRPVRRIPIDADAGLHLRVLPSALRTWSDPEPGRMFAATFRRTWRRLPAGVRESLLAHWRSRYGSPRIELGVRRQTTNRRGASTRILAVCGRHGHVLSFRPELEARTADFCSRVVAHELAHAFRHAVGAAVIEDWNWWDESEAYANRLAAAWGFPRHDP